MGRTSPFHTQVDTKQFCLHRHLFRACARVLPLLPMDHVVIGRWHWDGCDFFYGNPRSAVERVWQRCRDVIPTRSVHQSWERMSRTSYPSTNIHWWRHFIWFGVKESAMFEGLRDALSLTCREIFLRRILPIMNGNMMTLWSRTSDGEGRKNISWYYWLWSSDSVRHSSLCDFVSRRTNVCSCIRTTCLSWLDMIELDMCVSF